MSDDDKDFFCLSKWSGEECFRGGQYPGKEIGYEGRDEEDKEEETTMSVHKG
jgi:hypothetical protein